MKFKGGYGIGACIATVLAKPLKNFDAKTNASDEVNLKGPYWKASLFAVIVAFSFLISQLFEVKNNREHEINRRNYMLLMEDTSDSSSDSETRNQPFQSSNFNKTIQKLLFSDKVFKGKALLYMLTQIFIFILFFVMAQGSFTIVTRFMFTFLTRGPAKVATQTSTRIEMLFWIVIILSRFLSAFITTRIKPSKFLLIILFSNLIAATFLLVPILHRYEGFFWLLVPLIGFTSGPIIPCGLDLVKHMLKVNSFVLSVFIVGLAIGGIILQEVCGSLLDKEWIVFANQKSIIPYLSFFTSLATLFIFLVIYSLHRAFHYLVK